MRPTVFKLRLASGETWAGAIHGAGGPIAGSDARARLENLIRAAGAGKPLPVAEPLPGHVRGYRQINERDTAERMLDLRGAEVLAVEEGGGS